MFVEITCFLVRSINATLHKKIKSIVPKRYRFTLQSTLFEEKDQDIGTVYHRVWPLEGAEELELTVL